MTSPPADLLARDKFVSATREYFEILTQPVIAMRTPETAGRTFVSSYTRMVDAIVAIVFHRAAEENGVPSNRTGISVVAMGGYGRAELAPYSDIDVLIACSRRTRAVEKIAASFIRLMWDLGFELGHAVESLVESEKALTGDMDTKTALIESRWVCGAPRVARALEKQIGRIRRSDREEYLRRKIADAVARREKHGNSFQLIEPNVKSSPGGMRDLQTLVWLGQVGRGVRGLRALQAKGLLLRGERRELEAAYDFLLRVRVEQHLVTQSRQDQLTVELQQKLAPSLGYAQRGEHLAVEFFMREYYTHTRTIYRITEDCLDALERGANVGVMLGRTRIKRDARRLSVPLRRDTLRRDPLFVFRRQKETGEKLDRGLRRRLEAVLEEELRDAASVKRMRRTFPELLDDDRNAALVVRAMHDTRFLMRIIPEYDQLTCLKRYDLYHHFTVDEHSFKVLEYLTALGREDADTTDPFVRLYSELPAKRVLLMAALLHDVGKIEGRGHAHKGAVLSREILGRMGVGAEEIDQVELLIEHHLVMSHFSQRRDPSDQGTITAFCDAVGNRTNLKLLCLLTYADYRATSPEVWSDWKRTLLWELYVRAYDFLSQRAKQPAEVYRQHKGALLDTFSEGKERDRARAHLDMLPGGYLLNMTAEMVREHIKMIDQLDGHAFAMYWRLGKETAQVTFCTHDKPYRLSELCGVLTVNDFNILHAFAFTRKDGKVIDVFSVAPVADGLGADELARRFTGVEKSLAAVFSGDIDLDEETRRHESRWRRRRRAGIPVAVKVEFENDVSADSTILDIFAQDRPGLLYRITRTLSREGLTIFRANISTEATRAIDAFYVADADGSKITSSARLNRIRSELQREIDRA